MVGTCKPEAAEDVYSRAQVIDCVEYHITTPTLLILGEPHWCTTMHGLTLYAMVLCPLQPIWATLSPFTF